MKEKNIKRKIVKYALGMIGILFIIFVVYLVNRYLIPRVDSKIANTQIEKNEEKYEITENTYTSNEIKIKIDKKEEGEGKDKVTYVSMTADKVKEVVAKHLAGGEIIEEYTVEKA